MKKAYTVPQLTTHGNIAEITQAQGATSASDSIHYNNQPYGSSVLPGSLLNLSGSDDAVIQGCGRQGQPACTTPF